MHGSPYGLTRSARMCCLSYSCSESKYHVSYPYTSQLLTRCFTIRILSCTSTYAPGPSTYLKLGTLYSPPELHRIWGIWGSYYNIPEAIIFYLLQGPCPCFRVLGGVLAFNFPKSLKRDASQTLESAWWRKSRSSSRSSLKRAIYLYILYTYICTYIYMYTYIYI